LLILCSGYLPPEYIDKNIISKMFDIFSLGVVMIKIIAGPSGRMNSAEMPHEDFIDLVRNDISLYQDKCSIFGHLLCYMLNLNSLI
jgi:interleukin-1 receptor-associated kinase 1/coatomer subunit beta'